MDSVGSHAKTSLTCFFFSVCFRDSRVVLEDVGGGTPSTMKHNSSTRLGSSGGGLSLDARLLVRRTHFDREIFGSEVVVFGLLMGHERA